MGTSAKVLIVGAGPAGAALAALLASRGAHVTLVERRRDFAREFRGEVLMPGGVAALAAIAPGLLQRLPHVRIDRGTVYLNARPVLEGRLPEDLEVDAVSQPALLEELVATAARAPHFELVRGSTVRSFIEADGRVRGVLLVGDAAGNPAGNRGERTLDTDLVIGADGRHSAVRRLAGISARALDSPMDVVWAKLPLPDGWQGVRAWAGRGHLLIAYRTWDDTLQLGWVILKGTFGEFRARGVDQWVAEMANHVTPELADHLRLHGAAVDRPFLLEAVSDCVERWHTPGVLLIGDAAHTMSPVGAQGINMALRDAIVAANHLVPILGDFEPRRCDAALAAIEAERMPEITRIQALQAQPPRLILSRAWWAEPLRRVAGRVLVRAAARERPAVPPRLSAMVRAFAFGVTDVCLRV